MLPSFESLRCFCAAARTLNFREASKTVALSPAAFGHRIRQLEELLDGALFVRTTRRVRLTEAGQALLPIAERALEAVERCATLPDLREGFPRSSIVLGTRHELGLSWIVPQIDALSDAHPWLTLHLYFGASPDLLNRVRGAEIDCAVVSSAAHDASLDELRLHEERYVFVGSTAMLARTPLRRADHASAHTLIDIDGRLPLFGYWRGAPGAPPLRFLRVARFGTIDAIRARVLSGAGVAVLPAYLVRADVKERRLKVILPSVVPLVDHFRLVFRRGDPRQPMFEALAESMRRAPLK